MSVAKMDEVRFDALYRTTRRDVLAFLTRRSGDPDRAADLLAETYLVAWRKLREVPDGQPGRLWLFGVARNLLLKERGRRRSDNVLVERLASELHTAIAPCTGLEDHRSGPLAAAIAQLAQKEREILLLTAWEDLAPREIAIVTGSSANVVRVRLARARSKLRRELESLERRDLSPRTVAANTTT
jgi:RNA polymerase sigma-70 factor (ECF subfamily)